MDTATQRTVAALGDEEGKPLSVRSEAGGRSGETLLGIVDDLLDQRAMRSTDLTGLVVGLGPGSFTGLRVGMATVKTLAYLLGRPVTGVLTPAALALGAHEAGVGASEVLAVVAPAGVRDRYLTLATVEDGRPRVLGDPRLVPAGSDLLASVGGSRLLAVDLPATEVPEDAHRLGSVALEALGRSLLAVGAMQLRAGGSSEPAELVPAYVALPRGVESSHDTVEWSRDLR